MEPEHPGDATPTGDRRGSISELGIVFGLTVGIPLLFRVFGGHGYDFGQRRLLSTVLVEILAVAVLLPWLHRRGWSFGAIAGSPTPRDILRGTGVALAAYLAYAVAALAWSAFVPGGSDQLRSAAPAGVASAWVIILVSLVNPVVEEFLWLGYGYVALQRSGARVAFVASVCLRVAIHAYQGPLAIVGILPLALVFTQYFARTKRLWPVVVAHMLFDAIGLLPVLRS